MKEAKAGLAPLVILVCDFVSFRPCVVWILNRSLDLVTASDFFVFQTTKKVEIMEISENCSHFIGFQSLTLRFSG